MTPSEINESLDAFLSAEDRVLVIRGKWGVGKTHFWSNYVSDRITKKQIRQVAYSYISLFGKSSLSEVRASIFQAGALITSEDEIKKEFEETYSTSTRLLSLAPWLQTTAAKATGFARLTGWISNIAKSAPYTDKFSGLIASLEYKLVKKYLICIDDLERKGSNLSIREIMGLIDELANQKQCKVVLIFNDKSLNKSPDKEEFEEYKEKVVDVEIEYNPSFENTLSAAFAKGDENLTYLTPLTDALNLKNIRVLRKLKRVLTVFSSVIGNADPSIKEEFATHAAFITWSHFMRTEALPYEFVKSRLHESSWSSITNDNISDNEKRYREISQKIKIRPSIFSNFIIEYLEKGYIEIDKLQIQTQDLQLKTAQNNAHLELNSVWNLYTDSFADNKLELLKQFEETLHKHIDKIQISEFSSALEMIHELGGDAEQLMNDYISIHSSILKHPKPEEFLFVARVRFQPFKDKINALSSASAKFNIDEISERIATTRGWNEGDIEFLSSLSVEDIHAWMIANPQNMVAKIRSGLLFFRNLGSNSDEDRMKFKKISENTIDALRLIASQNDLNKRRVANLYSVSIE